jgi:hypothetical protein
MFPAACLPFIAPRRSTPLPLDLTYERTRPHASTHNTNADATGGREGQSEGEQQTRESG